MTADSESASSASGQRRSVAEDLQRLRWDAGGPSYAEIATRVSRLRAGRSAPELHQAVARSTVYDAFRTDRKRLDAALVTDIARALGASDDEASQWRRRCAQAELMNRRSSSPLAAPAPMAVPAARIRRSSRGRALRWVLTHRAVVVTVLILVATVLNVVGGQVVLWLDLPLFLDMIGTAAAAVLLGPWYGVAVAVFSQAAGALVHSDALGLPFTAVGVAGALLWGYGVHRWGMGRTAARFFLLTVLVAVSCTVLAAPITVFVYGGFSQHVAADTITDRLISLGDSLWAAVFSANLTMSLLDKLISGFMALTITTALVQHFSDHEIAIRPSVLLGGAAHAERFPPMRRIVPLRTA